MRKSDKMIWRPGEMKISPCLTCKHWVGGGVCLAFPDGVPDPILNAENDHIQPYDGDNGIQYEPIDNDRNQGTRSPNTQA